MPDTDRILADPLRNFKFNVVFANANTLGATGQIGFMSVSGMALNVDVIPYREGNYPTSPHKMPGQTDYQPVTFSRGLAMGDTLFMNWIRQVCAVPWGTKGPGQSNYDFRTSVEIQVLNHPVNNGEGIVKARFQLLNAWPTTVSFSDLDAGANQIIINQMTLVHEGFNFNNSGKGLDATAPTFNEV